MKTKFYFLGLLVFFFVIIFPVQAFEITSLAIDLEPSGDATVTIDYTLSMIEQLGVYLGFADPGLELKKGLESNFNHPVEVMRMSDESAQFLVSNFSKPEEIDGKILISTPELSYRIAEKVLAKYWFAKLLNPDFSPQIIKITYPDGYQETFTDQMVIPATSHEFER